MLQADRWPIGHGVASATGKATFSIWRKRAAPAGPLIASRQLASATRWCAAIASSAPVIIATPVCAPGCVSVRNGLIARLTRSRARRILKDELGGDPASRPNCRPIGSVSISVAMFSTSDIATSRQIRRTRSETCVPLTIPTSIRRCTAGSDTMAMMLGRRIAYIRLRAARMPSTCSAMLRIAMRSPPALIGGFLERLGQRVVVGVRCRQVAERTGQLQDLVGGFLDLPHPLEIADRAVVVFDPDAQQRQRRDFQQFGQPLDGVELDDLAFFIAIQGGAGDAQPGGDLLGAQAGFETIGPKLLADLGKTHRHGCRPLATYARIWLKHRHFPDDG